MKNVKKVILAHLNINSLRNKKDLLADFIQKDIDIMCICETKRDETFTTAQFCLDGFRRSFRRDRNAFSGGLLIYVNENIPVKQLMSRSSMILKSLF